MSNFDTPTRMEMANNMMNNNSDNNKLLEWIPLDRLDPSLPAGAVGGGYTEKGESTYVARCIMNIYNDGACGAYIPSLKVASIPYGGGENHFKQCDILVCRDPGILFWMNAEGGHVPDLAVGVGNMHTEEIYVARSRPDAELNDLRSYRGKRMKISSNNPMLGKLHPNHNTMYLAHDKVEYFVYKYQVLCAYRPPSISKHSYSWITVSDKHLPEGSVAGGMTDEGEPTYIARVLTRRLYGQGVVAGYVVPSERICHYSLEEGAFVSTNYYNVFVPVNPNCLQWKTPVSLRNSQNVVFVDDTRYDTASRMSVHSVNSFAVGRTTPGATLVPSSPHSHEKIDLKQAKVIGTVHSNDNYLSVAYKDQHYTTTQFEVLVAPYVPHTLLELSRYAVLRSTNAVPDRIDKLPLPERMKSFCQLRQEEKRLIHI